MKIKVPDDLILQLFSQGDSCNKIHENFGVNRERLRRLWNSFQNPFNNQELVEKNHKIEEFVISPSQHETIERLLSWKAIRANKNFKELLEYFLKF